MVTLEWYAVDLPPGSFPEAFLGKIYVEKQSQNE